MKIRDILARKGHQVVTISPDRNIDEALAILVEHGIGSLVVMEGEAVQGILTERDILRLVNRDPTRTADTRVDELMTSDLIIGVPDDELYYVMDIMSRNRIRHLPVVEGEELRGIISIGDVVNQIRKDVEAENRYLRKYVQGMVR